MNISTKLLKAAAGQVGGAGLDVDEVFSTFLYDGTGSTQTITNNIDLSGEGGLVWIKRRDGTEHNDLYDTVRGATKDLRTNATSAQGTESNGLQAFNSNGFTVGGDGLVGVNGGEYVSWTFRKAPKFFDVISIDVADPEPTSVTVNHNLGQEVGMVIMKPYLHTYPWYVWHRSIGANYSLELNSTANKSYVGGSGFSSTSTTITIPGAFVHSGSNNGKCILYLFAHNNNDGEFGPDSDQDIIKCGSYTGNGSADGPDINLGFEPQWIITKAASISGEDWRIKDVMRGWHHRTDTSDYSQSQDRSVYANGNAAEAGRQMGHPTATGFKLDANDGSYNQNGATYIYMAIRRGPLAAPEDATKVFSVATYSSNGNSNIFNTGFDVDMNINTRTGATQKYNIARLLGDGYLKTNTSGAETNDLDYKFFDNQSNVLDIKTSFWGTTTDTVSWSWKRAPSYFDVTTWTGTGSARTVPHGLTVPPEMIWTKRRNDLSNWMVYHSALGNTKALYLDSTTTPNTSANWWNNTSPTSSVFTVGTDSWVNYSGSTYIAYLFATVAGVSKVGSYTGNSTDGKQIDCGFSSGARFVLIKNTTVSNTNWLVFDTARGIVSGNDSVLELNSTDAQVTNTDYVDPYSSGFELTANAQVNYNGSTYIFYAIA